jgi:hypothetical protein
MVVVDCFEILRGVIPCQQQKGADADAVPHGIYAHDLLGVGRVLELANAQKYVIVRTIDPMENRVHSTAPSSQWWVVLEAGCMPDGLGARPFAPMWMPSGRSVPQTGLKCGSR